MLSQLELVSVMVQGRSPVLYAQHNNGELMSQEFGTEAILSPGSLQHRCQGKWRSESYVGQSVPHDHECKVTCHCNFCTAAGRCCN